MCHWARISGSRLDAVNQDLCLRPKEQWCFEEATRDHGEVRYQIVGGALTEQRLRVQDEPVEIPQHERSQQIIGFHSRRDHGSARRRQVLVGVALGVEGLRHPRGLPRRHHPRGEEDRVQGKGRPPGLDQSQRSLGGTDETQWPLILLCKHTQKPWPKFERHFGPQTFMFLQEGVMK